jgi:hypothetical protein
MKRHQKIIIFAAVLVFSVIVVFIVFLVRPPVLIVSDVSFSLLYGVKRFKEETARSSLVLFRRVKPVVVADDAGDDIVQAAVEGASKKPLCVLFPLRFARIAYNYREKNANIPVVLLEGRYTEAVNPASFATGDNTEDYFIYKTDISADFYRAGLAAAILDNEKNEKITVFLESNIQSQAKEAISKALNDAEKPLQTSFYTVFAQLSGTQNISCVIMAGTGAEYPEKYSDVPVIFFTWINPELIPADIVLVFNDSPIVQAVPAVRMVQTGMKKGQIPSKILYTGGKKLDKDTVRKLRKI